MKTFSWRPLTAVLLTGIVACSSGGGDDGPPPVAECDKPANVARAAALVAAQPTLAVRTKSVITAAAEWPSLAADPTVTCSVDLQFKDLNGNGALDGYEDWTRTAEQRAADLVGRMTVAEKLGLMAHATTTDVPTAQSAAVSASLQAMIAAGIRFGRVAAGANESPLTARATWANAVQERCEASALGIPFVLSMEPAHSFGGGRVKALGFSQWPSELSLAASNDLGLVERFGQVAAQEYRAIGVRMALSPSADRLTEPRWHYGQFTLGESSAAVSARVAAYVKGFQGAALGPGSVACVVSHFPGAGAAKDGFDARLAKGKYTTYPGGDLDGHLAAFEGALDLGVAGVMPGYGIPEQGSWTALDGLVDGSAIEQVGAAFHAELLGDVLRDHYAFGGLVLSPWGILEDAGLDPFGAPWGMETSTRAERAAKAVNAGVDQVGGLDDTAPLAAARTAGDVTDARIDAAAGRALALAFRLGLFEDPYVDAAQAPSLCNTDASYQAGLDALNRGMVLLVNEPKPDGWLNGAGDGTQVGDKGNAGNGTLKVLPAPPGEPYVAAGCAYFVLGRFDLDYVRSVSTGYGELTNDALVIDGVSVTTPEERIPLSDYVFVRIEAPFSADPDSGALLHSLQTLEYATSDNAAELDWIAFARDAIDAWNATREPTDPHYSRTQIVVGVSGGRPSVVEEILGYGVTGLYYEWGTSLAPQPDKVFLDVAFGIVNGTGKLPVGLPASDAAAAAQHEDLAGDGQDPTFVEGFGIPTQMYL